MTHDCSKTGHIYETYILYFKQNHINITLEIVYFLLDSLFAMSLTFVLFIVCLCMHTYDYQQNSVLKVCVCEREMGKSLYVFYKVFLRQIQQAKKASHIWHNIMCKATVDFQVKADLNAKRVIYF